MIESHKGILYKVSKMYMDNHDDQQDLFQEIVCHLWKSYDSFRNESQFSTWMYRVAVNTAIVFLKKENLVPDYFENKNLYFIKILNGNDTKVW